MCNNNYRKAIEKIKNIKQHNLIEVYDAPCDKDSSAGCKHISSDLKYNIKAKARNTLLKEIKSILAQADTDNKHEPDHIADAGKKVAFDAPLAFIVFQTIDWGKK